MNIDRLIFIFIIEPPILLPLTFGSEVVDEGEFAQLVCIVRKGDEPLTLSWALKGDKISSEPGLTTASLGTRTSMLTISSVGYRHSGTYTCTAKNKAGVTSQTATLKVNGNYTGKGSREKRFQSRHGYILYEQFCLMLRNVVTLSSKLCQHDRKNYYFRTSKLSPSIVCQ